MEAEAGPAVMPFFGTFEINKIKIGASIGIMQGVQPNILVSLIIFKDIQDKNRVIQLFDSNSHVWKCQCSSLYC